MARSAGARIQRTFIKGLITEATGINFPKDSSTETFNCVFDEKGRVTRRQGFEYESAATFESFDRSDGVVSEFYWEGAGSVNLVNLVVVQMKNLLHFYKEDVTAPLSSTYSGLVVDLEDFASGDVADIPPYTCQYSEVSGKLFVTHPFCEPFYVTYVDSVPSVTGTAISMKIRDLSGDEADTLYNNATTRPTATVGTTSAAHLYNLYNQGWAGNVYTIAGTTINPVTFWDSVLTTIPSNGDTWFLFKDADEKFDPANWADRTAVGSTLAPKGYYIINPFDTDRATVSGIVGVSETTSNTARPSCVAAYSGRIWYAGVAADGYSQKIYYSQVIVKGDEYGFCYQANDPTSEVSSDLLATDGGVLSIPEVGSVVKLCVVGSDLVVFGTNGVWRLSGSQGVGFNATDYSLTKVSSTPALSHLSFVDVYGSPIWWNTDGIFTLQADQLSGNTAAKSLTDATIRSFIDEIHPNMKAYVKGAFNKYSKTVQWLFRSSNTTNPENIFEYDRVLVLNTISGAFYPWTLPNQSPTINGMVVTRGPVSGEVVEDVVDTSSVLVTTIAEEPVTAEIYTTLNPNYSFRYLTTKKNGATDFDTSWSQTINTSMKDWGAVEAELDYDSYFFTDYSLDGDAQRFFQNNYVVVYTDAVTGGSCLLEPWWDYVTTTSSARVGNAQQIYPAESPFLTYQRRLKIRGKGRALQLKFYSEEGLPFSVVGWSVWSTQNNAV